MITLNPNGVFLLDGKTIAQEAPLSKDEAREQTIAYQILRAHDVGATGDKRPKAPGDGRGQSPLRCSEFFGKNYFLSKNSFSLPSSTSCSTKT